MQQDYPPAVDFGFFMPAGAVPGQPRIAIAKAEESAILPLVARHFDSIWVPDHFWAFTDPADSWLECWTLMTWLATRFPPLQVGPIVLGVGYRNPALLAKMANTLQVLSDGRFIMGIGAGWREPEYLAYGYDFPPAAVRIQQLEEAVGILRLMWTQPTPSFQGKQYRIKDAPCAPIVTAPRIMIGGGGEKRMLPLVGRLADIWDRYHGGPLETINHEEYTHKLAIVQASATEAGRDPTEIVQSFTIENGTLPASPADSANWVAQLRPLIDLGVRQFIVGFGHVTDAAQLERFATEVIAPIRGR